MNNRQFSWIQIVLIPLAVANLISFFYLEQKANSATAGFSASAAESSLSASNNCECPKVPPGGN